MTSNYHTPHTLEQPGTPAIFNAPLAELDGELTVVNGKLGANPAGGYATVQARFEALVLAGGNLVTTLTQQEASGAVTLNVVSTTGFITTAWIGYVRQDGVYEERQITVATGTTLTVAATGGIIANGALIAMMPTAIREAANAINHSGALTLPQSMTYAAADTYNVVAYGALGDGATDDTGALVAAITAAAVAGGTVVFPPGAYRIDNQSTTLSPASCAYEVLFTWTSGALGGTFQLMVDGSETAAIAAGAAAATVVAALEALGTVGAGNVACVWVHTALTDSYTITFQGTKVYQHLQLIVSTNSLTGTGLATAAVTQTAAGRVLAVPANVALDFTPGGLLDLDSDVGVLINGRLQPGTSQMFSVLGTVAFGPGSTDHVDVRWFGAVGDGVTDDTTAIATAIRAASATTVANAVDRRPVVLFPAGAYLSDAINVYVPNMELAGSNERSSEIICSSLTASAIRIWQGPIYIHDLTVTATAGRFAVASTAYATGTPTAGKHGIALLFTPAVSTVYGVRLARLTVNNHPDDGVLLYRSEQAMLDQVRAASNKRMGFHLHGRDESLLRTGLGLNATLRGCRADYNGNATDGNGIRLRYMSYCSLLDCAALFNVCPAAAYNQPHAQISITAGYGCDIISPDVEVETTGSDCNGVYISGTRNSLRGGLISNLNAPIVLDIAKACIINNPHVRHSTAASYDWIVQLAEASTYNHIWLSDKAAYGANPPDTWISIVDPAASLHNLVDAAGLQIAQYDAALDQAYAYEALNTLAATTDSAANMLPANSIILGVVARITQTITGNAVTTATLGDPTTAARFGTFSALTVGTTLVGLAHWQGSIAADAAGPVQTAAAQVRITVSGGTGPPTAGWVRVTVFYRTLIAHVA